MYGTALMLLFVPIECNYFFLFSIDWQESSGRVLRHGRQEMHPHYILFT